MSEDASGKPKSPDLFDSEPDIHPAYGMVAFRRVSIGGYGGGQFQNFFGSDLNNHMSCMRLVISTAARRRGTGQYYYHARDRLIEVDLTAAQFAELLTTPNVGDGVPCTIRNIRGSSVTAPPAVETSASKSQSEFEKKVEAIGKDAGGIVARLNALADSKTVKKGDLRDLARDLSLVVQSIEKNLPFTLTTFREAVQDIVQEAKAEVDAFVTNAVSTAGVDALAGQQFVPSNLLGPKEGDGGEQE